jgi:hypothetical protein
MNNTDIQNTVNKLRLFVESSERLNSFTTEHELTNLLSKVGVYLKSPNFYAYFSDKFWELKRNRFAEVGLMRVWWEGVDTSPGRFNGQWVYKKIDTTSEYHVCSNCGRLEPTYSDFSRPNESLTLCNDNVTCSLFGQWQVWIANGGWKQQRFFWRRLEGEAAEQDLQAVDLTKIPPAPAFWVKGKLEELDYFKSNPRPLYGGALKEVQDILEMLKIHKGDK